MARPSKPEDQRAALVVGVRLTPAEKALVDQLTAPGPDGAPPCWTNASGLLRGLLHREAQRRGLEPPDSSDVDGNPGGGLDEPGPPGRPATVADSVTNPPGGGSGSSGGLPPAGPPYPTLGGLPSALGGGVLPAGTLLLVWPPGWPLPMAPGGTFPNPGAVPIEAPRGVVPVPNLTAPGVSPPSMTPAPVETPPAGRDTPLPARPLPPMPEPSKMLARFERQLERSPGMMAKDVAAAAGLKPQDISTFRQGRRITEEKRAMLWTWMHRPDGAE